MKWKNEKINKLASPGRIQFTGKMVKTGGEKKKIIENPLSIEKKKINGKLFYLIFLSQVKLLH
jgi:hypothetical protein